MYDSSAGLSGRSHVAAAPTREDLLGGLGVKWRNAAARWDTARWTELTTSCLGPNRLRAMGAAEHLERTGYRTDVLVTVKEIQWSAT